MEGPGVGRVVIKEIEKVAEQFVRLDEEHDEAKDALESVKLELGALMAQHADALGRDTEGVVRYYCGDVCVTVAPGKSKITVVSKDDVQDPDNAMN